MFRRGWLALALVLGCNAWADDLPLVGSGRGSGVAVPSYGGNSCHATNGSTATTACTLTSAVVTGDVVTVFVSGTNTGTTATVADDKSDSCTAADSNILWNSSTNHAFSFVCASLTAGAQTFTVTWGLTGNNEVMVADDYQNVLAAAPLDVHAAQGQTSPGNGTNAVTSGAATSTAAGELVAGAMFSDSANLGTGFTQASAQVSGWFQDEFLVQSSAGAVAATFTATNTPSTTAALMLVLKHK